MQILRERLRQHTTWVFTYEGQRIHQVSTRAWYLAMKRAGIENFRWHDLRHTWASWHVQNGTPLFALQELGGWETAKMVRRYAHLNAEHVAPYAMNTESHGDDPTSGFSRHSPIETREKIKCPFGQMGEAGRGGYRNCRRASLLLIRPTDHRQGRTPRVRRNSTSAGTPTDNARRAQREWHCATCPTPKQYRAACRSGR